MIVGTACALGIDMGFNSSHHETEMAEDADHDDHDCCKKGGKIDHNDKENEKKGCCNDHVVNLSQTDKAIAQVFKLNINTSFETGIKNYYTTSLIYRSSNIVNKKHFVRSHHPPIPDIRIAIQSFQI